MNKTQTPKDTSTNSMPTGQASYRDLEERTAKFAERYRDYVKNLPRAIANIEYGKQPILSSGSQAGNYIEANEALGKKDFQYRIRISCKETKESCL
jgi:four helix bundle protein